MSRRGIRSVATVAGAVLALGALVAAIAVPAGRDDGGEPPSTFVPGLYTALLAACSITATQDAGALRRISTSTFGDGSGDTGTGDADSTAVFTEANEAAFETCERRHPVDASLIHSDDLAQRRVLLLWYLGDTVPCLATHGIEVGPSPRASVFERLPYGTWDPYAAVPPGRFDLVGLTALQRDCPPAPPALLAHSHAVRLDEPVWDPMRSAGGGSG